MPQCYSITWDDCKCILEHWEYISWGLIILVGIVILALNSKYFDDIV